MGFRICRGIFSKGMSENIMKKELVVWVDIDTVDMVQMINGFIPVCEYVKLENVNRWEWGKVEQDDLVIRYRATSAIKTFKQIFVG